MTAAHGKAPVLAWLLATLTCLLAGLAIVESQREAVALPAWPPVGEAVIGEGAGQPTATPEVTPRPAGTLTPAPHIVDALAPPSTSPALLRVARLTIPPGVVLPPEVAAGPMVLLVESGTLSIRVDGDVWGAQGLELAEADTVLDAGEGFVIAAGVRHAVRNDGPASVVASVIAIVSGETATPMLGPGEPPPGRSG